MNTKKISTELIRILLYLSDILSLNLSILFIYIYNYNSINVLSNEGTNLIYNNLLWIILSRIYKPYEIKRFQTSDKMLSKSFKLLLIFTLIKSANHILLKDFENMSALIFIEQLLLFRVLQFTLLIMELAILVIYNISNLAYVIFKKYNSKIM